MDIASFPGTTLFNFAGFFLQIEGEEGLGTRLLYR